MSNPGPVRDTSDLADVVEMLLDKGVVINADIAVSIGDTELLGIHIRAAIASFETAAKYGLAFPEGTDSERIAEIAGTPRPEAVGATGDEEAGSETTADLDAPGEEGRNERSALAVRPTADRPGAGVTEAEVQSDDDGAEGETSGDGADGETNDGETSGDGSDAASTDEPADADAGGDPEAAEEGSDNDDAATGEDERDVGDEEEDGSS